MRNGEKKGKSENGEMNGIKMAAVLGILLLFVIIHASRDKEDDN